MMAGTTTEIGRGTALVGQRSDSPFQALASVAT